MSLFAVPQMTAFDANGDPISGAKLNFYETGTTTPKTVYTDSALTTPASNPVVADAAGRFAPIYMTGEAYKVVFTDASDVTITTLDPIYGITGPITTTAATLLDDTSYSAMRQTLGVVWSSVSDVSTNTTVTTSNAGTIFRVDASGSNRTVTLPSASSAGEGFPVAVQKSDSSGNNVGINPDGSDTIEGASSLTISAQSTIETLVSDGTSKWIRVGASGGGGGGSSGLPRGYIYGLTLANDTDTDHDLEVGAGVCRDAGDNVDMELSAITKRIDGAWAAGDTSGGLPSSLTLATDTWYHVHAIQNNVGTDDAGFDTAVDATNLLTDSSYLYYRRLGSVLTDGSSNIIPFIHVGDWFLWTTAQHQQVTVGTSASTVTLDVPTGVRVEAQIRVWSSNSAFDFIVQHSDGTDAAPNTGASPGLSGSTQSDGYTFVVVTNTSAQIQVRGGTAGMNMEFVTVGWREIGGPRAAGGGGGGGSGTVTNVATGVWIDGGPITGTGTANFAPDTGDATSSIDLANDYLMFVDVSDSNAPKLITPDNVVPDASDSVKGKVELATTAEGAAGTDTARALTAAAGRALLNANAGAGIVDVASATTTDIGGQASRQVRITGTTTITGLGTVAAGTERHVRFAGALTLTHNGTSLILPGTTNITTAANDTAHFVSLGSGNWLCLQYKKADGTAIAGGGGGGAPTTSQYVTLAVDATLSNERVLTGGTGISLVDGGAGSTITINAATANATTQGIVELATTAEASAGTDTDRAVTPEGLQQWGDDNALQQGVYEQFVSITHFFHPTSNPAGDFAGIETTAGNPEIYGPPFDSSADEHMHGYWIPEKAWNGGTVEWRLHWTTEDTGTDGVAFGLAGVALGDSDSFDTSFGTAQLVTDDNQGAAEDVNISAYSSALTIAGSPADGELVVLDLYRDVSDANDDMAADAIPVGITIRYTINAADDS